MKRILTFLMAVLPLISFAQGNNRRIYPPSEDPTEGLRVYLQKLNSDERYFATPDPNNEGEILVYYLSENCDNYEDSLFIVLDKAALTEMKTVLTGIEKTMSKWGPIARKEGLKGLVREMPFTFPPVGIFFRRNCERYGEVTYYPYPETSWNVQFSTPEFNYAYGRSYVMGTHATIPSEHEKGGEYYIELLIGLYKIKDFVKYMDYESLKRTYLERKPKERNLDELFK